MENKDTTCEKCKTDWDKKHCECECHQSKDTKVEDWKGRFDKVYDTWNYTRGGHYEDLKSFIEKVRIQALEEQKKKIEKELIELLPMPKSASKMIYVNKIKFQIKAYFESLLK